MLSTLCMMIAVGVLQAPEQRLEVVILTGGNQEVHPALRELNEYYDVEKLPQSKTRPLIEQYEREQMFRFNEQVPYIPNWYKKGDPVPYMPGAGEPYLDVVARLRKLLHESR